uniref:Uncharacterized protein n=1 Tax=Kalanchoe fedtschenkoi TaxID=63787 RepID=A0A7N0ZV46_KALFE
MTPSAERRRRAFIDDEIHSSDKYSDEVHSHPHQLNAHSQLLHHHYLSIFFFCICSLSEIRLLVYRSPFHSLSGGIIYTVRVSSRMGESVVLEQRRAY